MGGAGDILNVDCEPGNSKWLAKGNAEVTHKSNLNCREGVTQWLSFPESAHMPIHTYCTFFLLISSLLDPLLCLCGNSFLQSQTPESLSLMTGLVARIWYFHCRHPASISGWESKPCSKQVQTEATWDQSQTLTKVQQLAAAAKSLQSRLTLCDRIDGSPPGSSVPGILQARTREWVAISFSSAWKWKVKVKWLSRVRLFVTPRTAAYQAPPSVGFSRQEC